MYQYYKGDHSTMDASKFLSELNPEQLSAVAHNNGSLLVVAGAGSGKTKVLTTRIAWLIKTHGISINEILAVTFTNKAAREMSSRVAKILAVDTRIMWIGTFHSIALRFLTQYKAEALLPNHFQIIDNYEQLSQIKKIIKNSNLDEDRYPAKELQKFINRNKENGIRPSELTDNSLREKHWIQIYTEYEAVCNREGLVDFTELLLRSYELLKREKHILKRYQTQFKYILVDEFQDTNSIQYRWLKLLCNKDTQVFAVGDDDQSIYSFRGAKVSNMKSFLLDFNAPPPIRLEQNYRSTTKILDAANTIINNNGDRIGKKLWTNNHCGENVRLYEGYTEEDEAYFVADEIKSLCAAGTLPSDIAILYRSNAQSRVFEQHFYRNKIPYRVYGGLRFFDRQEIKHVLAYLRLVVNKQDNDAFLRVVNFPPRGIGAKSIEKIQELAKINQISLFDACSLLEGKAQQTLTKFTSIIDEINTYAAKNTTILSEIIDFTITKSGMLEYYQHEKSSGTDRIENLNELVNSVINYKDEGFESPISSFLAHAVLETGEAQAEKYEHAVQLMTIHAAKGLEFKVVFIVGLEDGLFPHESSLENQPALEEERRLMYVAITRAQTKLYLLRACSRLMWGRRQSAPLSRFVNELPSKLITNLTSMSQVGYNSLDDYTHNNQLHEHVPVRIISPENRTSHINIEEKSLSLKIGDIIKHNKFGNGKILELNATGKKLTALVLFIGLGKKTLDLNIAKVEKV